MRIPKNLFKLLTGYEPLYNGSLLFTFGFYNHYTSRIEDIAWQRYFHLFGKPWVFMIKVKDDNGVRFNQRAISAIKMGLFLCGYKIVEDHGHGYTIKHNKEEISFYIAVDTLWFLQTAGFNEIIRNGVAFNQNKNQSIGYSHRAQACFNIGDRIFEREYVIGNKPFNRCGIRTIRTKSDLLEAATNFADYIA